MMDAHGVALVTGGSRGIGRAAARLLARDGYRVVVNYRSRPEEAEETVRSITDAGGEAVALAADVGDDGAVGGLFEQIGERYGRLDVLVNNAGITRDTLLLRMDPEKWDQVLTTNLRGAYLCSRAAARLMTKQRSGVMINITSVVGLTGNAGQANYAAAKAGLIGLTKSLAKELASRSIRVNAIAPGFISTEMTAALSEKVQSGVLAQIPLGRFGSPEDVAEAVSFLASPRAAYITGQVIPVDGGLVG